MRSSFEFQSRLDSTNGFGNFKNVPLFSLDMSYILSQVGRNGKKDGKKSIQYIFMYNVHTHRHWSVVFGYLWELRKKKMFIITYRKVNHA